MICNITTDIYKNIKVKSNIIGLDTNILYWVFYDKCTFSNSYQKDFYPNFFKKLLEGKNQFVVSTLSINELMSNIEKNEWKIYCAENNLTTDEFNLKKYRGLVDEKKNVKNTLNTIYEQISAIVKICDTSVNKVIIDNYIENFDKSSLDINDYIIIKCFENNDVDYIFTDDSDFKCCGEQFNILTANNKLII